MITTDWPKCDKKDCNLVAWIVMENPIYEVHVNVCSKHYEELREEKPDWVAKDLNSGMPV